VTKEVCTYLSSRRRFSSRGCVALYKPLASSPDYRGCVRRCLLPLTMFMVLVRLGIRQPSASNSCKQALDFQCAPASLEVHHQDEVGQGDLANSHQTQQVEKGFSYAMKQKYQ